MPRLIAVMLITLFLGAAQAAELRGFVRFDEEPFGGAQVTLENSAGFRREWSTRENGEYKFEGLSAGQYEIRVDTGIGSTAKREICLEADDISLHDFRMDHGCYGCGLRVRTAPLDPGSAPVEVRPSPVVFAGYARDQRGNPVGGATVLVRGCGDTTSLTDQAGRFEVSAAACPWHEILVSSPKAQEERFLLEDDRGHRALIVTLFAECAPARPD